MSSSILLYLSTTFALSEKWGTHHNSEAPFLVARSLGPVDLRCSLLNCAAYCSIKSGHLRERKRSHFVQKVLGHPMYQNKIRILFLDRDKDHQLFSNIFRNSLLNRGLWQQESCWRTLAEKRKNVSRDWQGRLTSACLRKQGSQPPSFYLPPWYQMLS